MLLQPLLRPLLAAAAAAAARAKEHFLLERQSQFSPEGSYRFLPIRPTRSFYLSPFHLFYCIRTVQLFFQPPPPPIFPSLSFWKTLAQISTCPKQKDGRRQAGREARVARLDSFFLDGYVAPLRSRSVHLLSGNPCMVYARAGGRKANFLRRLQ
jgi:hypothetical protein